MLQTLVTSTQSNTAAIGRLSEMLREYARINDQVRAVAKPDAPAPALGPKVREPRAYDGDRSDS